MKKVIRLTESDLHRVIKESMTKILFERTKGEKGLSDDEVIHRRNMNFSDSINDEYGDSIYDDEQENYNRKLRNRRLNYHKQTQNHKEINESIYDDDYEEIIPLYDIFKNGFEFDEYYREKILLDTSLCYKDGRELGVCLNDLCLKSFPNKRRYN